MSEYEDALREVDALTPGSEPMAPAPKPRRELPMGWRFDEQTCEYVDMLSGRRVSLEAVKLGCRGK